MLQHWIVITELFWIPRVDDRSCTVFSFNFLLNHDIMYRNKMLMYMLFFKKIHKTQCYLHAHAIYTKNKEKLCQMKSQKCSLWFDIIKNAYWNKIYFDISLMLSSNFGTHTHTHTIWAGRDYSTISQLSQLLISIISGSQIIRYQLKIFAPKFSTVLYCAFSFLG